MTFKIAKKVMNYIMVRTILKSIMIKKFTNNNHKHKSNL